MPSCERDDLLKMDLDEYVPLLSIINSLEDQEQLTPKDIIKSQQSLETRESKMDLGEYVPLLSVIGSLEAQEQLPQQSITISKIKSQLSLAKKKEDVDECYTQYQHLILSTSAQSLIQEEVDELERDFIEVKKMIEDITHTEIECIQKITLIHEAQKSLFLKDSPLLNELEKTYKNILTQIHDEQTLQLKSKAKVRYKEIELLLEQEKQKLEVYEAENLTSDEISFSNLQINTISFIQSESVQDQPHLLLHLERQLFAIKEKICLDIIKEIEYECLKYKEHLQKSDYSLIFLSKSPTRKIEIIDHLLKLLQNQDIPLVKIVSFNSKYTIFKENLETQRNTLPTFFGGSAAGKDFCDKLDKIISLNHRFIALIKCMQTAPSILSISAPN